MLSLPQLTDRPPLAGARTEVVRRLRLAVNAKPSAATKPDTARAVQGRTANAHSALVARNRGPGVDRWTDR